MTLDFQLQQVPFTYGLAEGTDPLAVPFGILTRLENYVWKKHGRIEKRFGVTVLGAVPGALRLLVRGHELCCIDGTSLLSRNASGAWTAIADVPDAGVMTSPLLDPIAGIQASDTALSGEYVVTAFIPGDPTNTVANGVFVVVESSSTGALLLPVTMLQDAAVTTSFGVRAIVIGTTAIIVASGNDATIRAWTIDLSTMAIGPETALQADRDTGAQQNWDARLVGGSSLFVLAYRTTSGGGGVSLTTYDASLALQQTALTALGTLRHLAVDATAGESVCVAYQLFAGLVIAAFIADPTTMIATAGPTSLDTSNVTATRVGVSRFDATTYAIAYTRQPAAGATTIAQTQSQMFTSAAAIVANSRRATAGITLVSNPFVVNGRCYAFGLNAAGAGTSTALPASFTGNSTSLLKVWPGADDGTSATTDLTHPRVACVDPFLGAFCTNRACLPVLLASSSTKACGAIPFIGTVPNSQFTWRCAVRLVTVTAGADAPSDMWRTLEHGTETFIAGGVLSVYDGGDLFDYGFDYAPTLLEQSTAGAGGFITVGDYFHASHLEYRGASGLLYRGPTVVGPPLSVAGPTSIVTLRFGNFNVGNKKHAQSERFATSMPIFRTTANGTVPQRLTEEPTYNLSPCTYSASSLVFVDTRADAAIDPNSITLASRPPIYTTGGVLDDFTAPANLTMFGHVDRIFVLSCDQRRWWFSKTFQDDLGVAPGFHPDNTIAFEEDQTCGGSLDEKAIFFSETKINYTLGLGPAPNGQNGEPEFTTPIKLQTDAGCTQARSLVSTPDGLMYRSALGIHLLTRGLEVQWIGRSVQDDLDAFPTITSATLVPYASEIRFTCSDGEHGIVLVYNYVEKQWSTAKYLQDADGNGVLIVDACMHAGVWTFVASDGRVFKEDTTTYLDDGVYVPDAIETAWISGGGPITYQSVRNFFLVGTSHTDHALTVDVGFDSEQGYVQSRLFPARSGVTEVSDLEDLQISIGTRRKCGSIRFRIRSSMPLAAGSVLGNGRGPSFQTMGIEVGIKQGSPTAATKKG